MILDGYFHHYLAARLREDADRLLLKYYLMGDRGGYRKMYKIYIEVTKSEMTLRQFRGRARRLLNSGTFSEEQIRRMRPKAKAKINKGVYNLLVINGSVVFEIIISIYQYAKDEHHSLLVFLKISSNIFNLM